MINMINVLGFNLETISLAMLLVASITIILVVFINPKKKPVEQTSEKFEEPALSIDEAPVIEPVVESVAVEEEAIVEPVVEEPVVVVEQKSFVTAVEQPAEDVVEEVVESVVVEEVVAEPVSDVEQEVVATETKAKLNIPVGKKRTFAEKVCDADEENQAIYNLLKNELMSYKKVNNRLTKVIDIFKNKGAYLAKIGLTGKTIKLHLALDPNEYATTKYHHQDLGEKKKYEFVPLALKVKSPRSQKYAIELIAGVMEKAGLAKDPKYQQTDYVAMMKEAQVPTDAE